MLRKWSLKPVNRSPDEICQLLESWINNEVDWSDWDYFEACVIQNPELESIRQRCMDIDHFESEYLDHTDGKFSILNEKGHLVVKKLLEDCRLLNERT